MIWRVLEGLVKPLLRLPGSAAERDDKEAPRSQG